MTQVILHIGMHKTGSSSIQETLAGFDDGRTRYARLGPEANHSLAIMRMFGTDSSHPHAADARRGRSAQEVAARTARLRAALRTQLAQGGRLILSAESLSMLEGPEVTRLRRFLLRHGATGILVIGYARAPLSFAASALQQRIRNDVADLSVPRPGYKHRFRKFIAQFGADAVQILPFDRARLTGGSVVADFLTRCGIDPASLPEKRSNETMKAAATRLVFDFNRSGVMSHGRADLLKARIGLIRAVRMADTGLPFVLPEGLAAQAQDPEDVAWLRKATGIGFTLPDLPERLPAAEVSARLAAELALRPGDLALLRDLARARGLDLPDNAPPARIWPALFAAFLARASADRLPATVAAQADSGPGATRTTHPVRG